MLSCISTPSMQAAFTPPVSMISVVLNLTNSTRPGTRQYDVPLDTHTYLIETISKSLHPRVFLSSRFISFHRTNLLSSKPQVRLLANLFSSDLRTKYGRNLRGISDELETPCELLTKHTLKKNMTYKVVPEHEHWRTKLVDELLGARFGALDLPLSVAERDEILNFVCTS